MRCAFIKGAACSVTGGSMQDCPYADKRKPSGKLSWSRAFINAWRDGFNYGLRYREDALITLKYSKRLKKGK